MNNTTSLNKIQGVKTFDNKLMEELLSIKEDFELMEKHFNEKFDTLIDEKKKTLNHLYFDHSPRKEQETESDKRVFSALSDNVYRPFFEKILSEIVFDDFLVFYDEFSYAINERIEKMYKKLKSVENKSNKNTFVNRVMAFFKSIINKLRIKNIKYRDLHYFLNKLEDKLSKKLKIAIPKIRAILYEYIPNDVKSQPEQIRRYYMFILVYKRLSSPSNMEINKFFRFYSDLGRDPILRKKAVNAFMSNYTHYFNKNLPYLYDYHITISEKLTLKTARFVVYEKFLNKYKDWNEIPFNFNEEDKKLFLGYNIRLEFGIKTAIRRVIFKYLNYSDERYNEYFFKFEEMKQFL